MRLLRFLFVRLVVTVWDCGCDIASLVVRGGGYDSRVSALGAEAIGSRVGSQHWVLRP